MDVPHRVTLVEVGARDGLQSETQSVDTSIKIGLINRLAQTGLSVVEAASFVSPMRMPNLADGEAVMQGITRLQHVRYPVLVPNMRGLTRALAAGEVRDLCIFLAATDAFSQNNIECSVAESLVRYQPVIDYAAKHAIHMRAYVSCVFGCPFSGWVDPSQVAELSQQLVTLGCDEIALSDTIGIAQPNQVQQVVRQVAKAISLPRIAVHCHDTYGLALANIYAALQAGVRIIDSALSGLGGCPYAPGASGNIATEKVVFLCQQLGLETGVDLAALTQVATWFNQQLQRPYTPLAFPAPLTPALKPS